MLIRENLPILKREICKKREENEAKLKSLGEALPRDNNEKFEFMWNLIEELVTLYKNEIQGRYDPIRAQLRKKASDASIGSKIRQKFDDFFKDYVSKDYRASGSYTEDDIERALNDYQGNSIPGFPSMDAFLYLINPKLEQLRAPTLELLEKIYLKLEKLTKRLTRKIFERFPEIEQELYDIIITD